MSVRILALDTSVEACSVALLNGEAIDTHFELCEREHSQRILPMVAAMLERHQLTLTQLDALAFGRGPGSFTGVRIGAGVVQGLALGANLPVIGVSTLMTMAEEAWQRCQAASVLVAIDARMGEVYWAEYQRQAGGEWLGEESETVWSPAAAQARMQQLTGAWYTAGTGWQVWPGLREERALMLHNSEVMLPQAAFMLPLARRQLALGQTVPAEAVEPCYLRNEVTWKKLPNRG